MEEERVKKSNHCAWRIHDHMWYVIPKPSPQSSPACGRGRHCSFSRRREKVGMRDGRVERYDRNHSKPSEDLHQPKFSIPRALGVRLFIRPFRAFVAQLMLAKIDKE